MNDTTLEHDSGITDTAGPIDCEALLNNLHGVSETIGELLWERMKRL